MSAKYVSRIQVALDKLGKNGTSIPDGVPPANITTNEDTSAWHDKHHAVAEFLVASNMKRIAEGREKRAKANVEKLLKLDEIKRVPGDATTYGFDNVSLTVKISAARKLLDRSKLFTNLTLTGKLTAEEVEKLIAQSEVESTPPRTLTASTTVE